MSKDRTEKALSHEQMQEEVTVPDDLGKAMLDIIEKAKKYDALVQFHPNRSLRCSFCFKPDVEAKKLIAGPNVYICDECISLCWEVINDEISLEEREK